MFKTLLFSFVLFSSHIQAADYIAHEWGTFTSLMGSDGERQDGMYHEDEELPSFVHRFGEDLKLNLPSSTSIAQNSPPPRRPCCNTKAPPELIHNQLITQKMETPVLYFYANKGLSVNVDVGFPQGVIAESYPKATFNFPLATSDVILKNGFSHYEVNVLPKVATLQYAPLAVDSQNIYSHARQVNSNLIESKNEIEKFIFYRGLGNFQTDLKITSKEHGLLLKNDGKNIPSILLLNFDQEGRRNIINLGSLSARGTKQISPQDLQSFTATKMNLNNYLQEAQDLLKEALTKNGLYQDEAQALINTWKKSYLLQPGLRVLYILNRDEVERILPMNITPAPKELNRVFVGRIEILTEDKEEDLFQRVLNEKENFKVESLGRMAHPIAHRLWELSRKRKIKSTQAFDNLLKEASKI